MTALAHRPAVMPNVRRLNARAALDVAVQVTRLVLDQKLLQARRAAAEELECAHLELTYAALFHREADVLRHAAFCLATDVPGGLDRALAILRGWDRNPHRTA